MKRKMSPQQWKAIHTMGKRGYRWGGFTFELVSDNLVRVTCRWDSQYLRMYTDETILSDEGRKELRRLYGKYLEVKDYL